MSRGEFAIRVEGLDDLRKDLKTFDDQLAKEMGKVNKEIGPRIVGWSESRRSQMAVRFPSYASDVVTVKASADQRQVEIDIRPQTAERGTDRHPVFGTWADQSGFARKVWPEPNREGWLVRPTVDERSQMIADDYLEAVAKLARKVIGA